MRKNPVKKTVGTMTDSQLNKALDLLDAQDTKLTDQLIKAGRGYERASETLIKNDSLSIQVFTKLYRKTIIFN